MFSKILVANRAEIAVRVIRTCRELGIRSVAVHSDADSKSMHVRLADEAVAMPGTSAADTYLDGEKIIAAALDTGAEAIHPGYGFLAENADFAAAVRAAGLTFIGPPAEAIKVMGEKVAARNVATAADVPQVPGSKGAIESADEVLAFGEEHGYPIAIKASYGGGGRGMRAVAQPAAALEALDAARRESAAAFGRDEVYLERYLEDARHVEVQVFADTHGNVVWLGDRDCSVQRRHQKLVEEAPAPGLSDAMRVAMGEASVRLAQAVDYVGAGTVEFLVEAKQDRFYFLEMNTRIQVEHPVTEQTLGVDLIAEQIRVAAGEKLSFSESGPIPRGHAIEIRVNAEDVTGGSFRPSPGLLKLLDVPARPGTRFDPGYSSGDEVLPYYDSLIGKLVIWAPTRAHAIERALESIKEIRIEGVPTTLPAAGVILDHPDFRNAAISTRWLESRLNFAELLPAPSPVVAAGDDEVGEDESFDRQEVFVAGRRYYVTLPLETQLQEKHHPGARGAAAGRAAKGQSSGRPRIARSKAAGSGTLTSPMQGTIITVNVVEGQAVKEGEIVVVMEAMKMENPVRAAIAGTVTSLPVSVGQVVPSGTVLAEITAVTS